MILTGVNLQFEKKKKTGVMIRDRGNVGTGPNTSPAERTWTKLSQSHIFPYSESAQRSTFSVLVLPAQRENR
jgi:hypothetical protein